MLGGIERRGGHSHTQTVHTKQGSHYEIGTLEVKASCGSMTYCLSSWWAARKRDGNCYCLHFCLQFWVWVKHILLQIKGLVHLRTKTIPYDGRLTSQCYIIVITQYNSAWFCLTLRSSFRIISNQDSELLWRSWSAISICRKRCCNYFCQCIRLYLAYND